ncbi:MAG: hypothetical protein R3247_01335 [Rhodothermales bacterium]|nr:hypothetical protein [Rhodothermales bacterium]
MSSNSDTSRDTLFRLTAEQLADPQTYARDKGPHGFTYRVEGLGRLIGEVAAEIARETGAPLAEAKREIREGLHAARMHEATQARKAVREAEAKKARRKLERRRAAAGTYEAGGHTYRVSYDEGADHYLLAGPKNLALIDALKEHVPNRNRRWDPAAGAWVVAGSSQRRLQDVLSRLDEIVAAGEARRKREREAARQQREREAAAELAEKKRRYQAAREAAEAVAEEASGAYPGIHVSVGANYDRKGQEYIALRVHFAKDDEANAIARAAGLWWDGTGYSRSIEHVDAGAVREVLPRIQARLDEARAERQAALEAEAAGAEERLEAKRREDEAAGRIYRTYRNWFGGEVPRYVEHEGAVYRLETERYSAAEYGDDGDPVMSCTYLRVEETPEEANAAEIEVLTVLLRDVEEGRRPEKISFGTSPSTGDVLLPDWLREHRWIISTEGLTAYDTAETWDHPAYYQDVPVAEMLRRSIKLLRAHYR